MQPGRVEALLGGVWRTAAATAAEATAPPAVLVLSSVVLNLASVKHLRIPSRTLRPVLG